MIYWFIVHPYVEYWRKRGIALTYTILLVVLVSIGYGIYVVRAPLLSIEFGSHLSLLPLALLFYAGATVIEVRCRKYLKLRILIGLPELAPGKNEPTLLQEGIYSTIRHPRYVAIAVGLIAWALLANYLAVYVLVPLVTFALYFIVLFEEKELIRRFGERYLKYAEDVPRFIPRFSADRLHEHG